MTQPNSSANMTLMLGEMRGQLRELIHSQNNTAAKVDALASEMAKISSVPAELAELRVRVAALEAERHKRDGAIGLGSWLLGSRLVGWVVAAGLAIFAYLETRR